MMEYDTEIRIVKTTDENQIYYSVEKAAIGFSNETEIGTISRSLDTGRITVNFESGLSQKGRDMLFAIANFLE